MCVCFVLFFLFFKLVSWLKTATVPSAMLFPAHLQCQSSSGLSCDKVSLISVCVAIYIAVPKKLCISCMLCSVLIYFLIAKSKLSKIMILQELGR